MRAVASDLKGELDWIVMKALDKDRARRYESPGQLAADVERHLAGEAVVAAPASVGYRVSKFVRRNRGKVWAGGAVAGALMLGAATTTWLWNMEGRAYRRAEAANESLKVANEKLAAQLETAKEYFHRFEEKLHGIQMGPGSERFVGPGAEQFVVHHRMSDGTESISFPDEHMIDFVGAWGIAVIDEMNHYFEELQEKEAETTAALTRERAATEQLRAEVRRARLAEADVLCLKYSEISRGQEAEAIAALSRAFATREELLGLGDDKTLQAVFAVGTYEFPDYERTYSRLHDVVRQLDRLSPTVTNQMLVLWDQMAIACTYSLRFDEAVEWYRRIGREIEHIPDYAYSDEVGFPGIAFDSARRDREYNVREYASLHVDVLAQDLRSVQADAIKKNVAWIEQGQLEDFMLRREDPIARPVMRMRATVLAAAAPDDPGKLSTVAFAQYRLDECESAIATLTRIGELRGAGNYSPRPRELAILAMSHFKLHHADQSRATLAQLRILMSDPASAETSAKDEDAKALLKEAEELIEGGSGAK